MSDDDIPRRASAAEAVRKRARGILGLIVDPLVAVLARLGVSPNRVGPAVNALVEAGVLAQRNVGRQRYRLFEAPAVLDLWATVDAELVTPRLGPAPE